MSGVPFFNFVVDSAGNAIPGVSVSILTFPPTFSPLPGSPLASIFSDQALSVPLSNPLTTDSLGRFQFWVAPGIYAVQIFGSQLLATYNYYIDLPGLTSTPGGSTNSIQINNGGVFYGDSNFTYDPTGPQVTLTSNDSHGLTIQQGTAATGGANKNSPILTLSGNYWNGSASAGDLFQFQVTEATGTNPLSTLTIGHSGSSGGGAVSIGSLPFTCGGETCTGTLNLLNPAVATGGANQNSRILQLTGSYWNGSAGLADFWTIQATLATGTNPLSTLAFVHTGSPSGNQVTFPGAVNVAGTATIGVVVSSQGAFRFVGGASGSVFPVSSVANSVGALATYQATIPGGGQPVLGQRVTIAGFLTGANNGYFVVHDATTTTLTVYNSSAVSETRAATATMDFPYVNNAGFDANLGGGQTFPISGVSQTVNAVFESYPFAPHVSLNTKGNALDAAYLRIITDGATGNHGLEIGAITDGTGASPAKIQLGVFGGAAQTLTLLVPLVTPTHTPSSASDTGITGQYAWDASFIYQCIATNTWKRVAIASW